MWTDASIGKTSTNGGVIDVPVRSWGIFVGVFGKRKNSFEYADGLCDLDYTAIPLGWVEDVWLSQSLISSCIGTAKNCGEDLQPFNPEAEYEGEFYAGLDPDSPTPFFHITIAKNESVDFRVRAGIGDLFYYSRVN
jgi:hypothetical protein